LTMTNGKHIATLGDGGGGGLHNGSTGTVNVINCTISGNSAFRDNSLGGFGAGISSTNGTLNVINSTITGNTANVDGHGGGIGVASILGATSVTNIVNWTVTGNSAGFGGGIDNDNARLNVTNSTISGNTAISGEDGGILSSGTTTVKSSIIARNGGSPADVAGAFISAGFNLIGKTDGSTGFTASTDKTGTAASPLDPMLDANGLQNNG